MPGQGIDLPDNSQDGQQTQLHMAQGATESAQDVLRSIGQAIAKIRNAAKAKGLPDNTPVTIKVGRVNVYKSDTLSAKDGKYNLKPELRDTFQNAFSDPQKVKGSVKVYVGDMSKPAAQIKQGKVNDDLGVFQSQQQKQSTLQQATPRSSKSKKSLDQAIDTLTEATQKVAKQSEQMKQQTASTSQPKQAGKKKQTLSASVEELKGMVVAQQAAIAKLEGRLAAIEQKKDNQQAVKTKPTSSVGQWLRKVKDKVVSAYRSITKGWSKSVQEKGQQLKSQAQKVTQGAAKKVTNAALKAVDPGVRLAIKNAGTQHKDGSMVLETKDYNLKMAKDGQITMSNKESGQPIPSDQLTANEQGVLDKVGQKGREKYANKQTQTPQQKPPVAKQRPVAVKR